MSKGKEENPDFAAERNVLVAAIAVQKKELCRIVRAETVHLQELNEKLKGAIAVMQALER